MKVIFDNQAYVIRGKRVLTDVQLNELLQIIPELKDTEYVKYRMNANNMSRKRPSNIDKLSKRVKYSDDM